MEKKTSTTSKDMPQSRPDEKAIQAFADLVVKKMECCATDWKQPWVNIGFKGLPENLDGRRYSGYNTLFLLFVTEDRKYQTPVFTTFLQAKQNGLQIKKGEKAFPVFYYNFSIKHRETGQKITTEDWKRLSKDKQAEYKVIPFRQIHPVFNIEQTDIKEVQPELWEKLQNKYTVKASFDTSQVISCPAIDTMLNEQGWLCPIYVETRNDAFYSIRKDDIHSPRKEQFEDGAYFYTTIFHEMTHSTGSKGRLGRNFDDITPQSYGREELIAELTSVLVAASLGISATPKEENVAYLKNWCEEIKKEPKFILSILTDVNKASQMILDVTDKYLLIVEQKVKEEQELQRNSLQNETRKSLPEEQANTATSQMQEPGTGYIRRNEKSGTIAKQPTNSTNMEQKEVNEATESTVNWKTLEDKFGSSRQPLTSEEKEALLRGESIHLSGLTARNGRTFDADVFIDPESNKFKYGFPEGEATYQPMQLTEEQQKALDAGEKVRVNGLTSKAGKNYNVILFKNPETGKTEREWPVRDVAFGVPLSPEQQAKLQNGEYLWIDGLKKKDGTTFKAPVVWDAKEGKFGFKELGHAVTEDRSVSESAPSSQPLQLSEEQQKALEAGEKVRVDGLTSKAGKNYDVVLSKNPETGKIEREWAVRKAVLGVELSQDQQKKLQNGEYLWIDGLKKKDGTTFKAPVIWNAKEGKFGFAQFSQDKAKEQHPPLKEKQTVEQRDETLKKGRRL